MRFVINNHVVLSRAPEGPLKAYLDSFAGSLSAQGYSLASIRRQVLLAACFSRWLEQEGVLLRGVTADHPAQYLRYRARRLRPRRGDAAALGHLLAFLRHGGVIPAEKKSVHRLTPVERRIQAYEQYLREVRGLTIATVVNYVPFVRRFLDACFGSGPVRLSRLRADDVVSFVQREAPRLHLRRAKLMTTALRSFLRYARYRGAVTRDLAAVVPVVANWSMPSIPRAIGIDHVQRLLDSIDRHTAVGH